VDDVDYPYEFLAVDGGMTNNEPIAEVQRILADFETKRIGEVTESKNPIILIDPFPSLKMSENKPYCIDNDAVSEILLPLYQTLKNQTLFKENDLMDLLDDESFKTMIWPTRRDENGVLQENAIASGALDGFGGFLDKDYRIHDYMLGMKNCQNFLRYYFCQKYEDAIQHSKP